jgi:hypothetical protein
VGTLSFALLRGELLGFAESSAKIGLSGPNYFTEHEGHQP